MNKLEEESLRLLIQNEILKHEKENDNSNVVFLILAIVGICLVFSVATLIIGKFLL